MSRQGRPSVLVYPLLLAHFISPACAEDFFDCINDIKSGRWGSTGATDISGNPVANMSDAAVIPYSFCVRACGSSFARFQWSFFFQQFSTWLLPWFALASQLPYGGRFNRDNLLAVALTLGSPTLAGYSLALTALNIHWIARRFDGLAYPNSRCAAYILASLQYMPIQVTTDDGLLSSLVVLPQNDPWWEQVADRLNYAMPWTLTVTFNMLWVLIPYSLTITTSITDFITSEQGTGPLIGQNVGAAWFWMIALVAGWQWVSPKCNFNQVDFIVKHANEIAYVAAPNGILSARDVSTQRAICLQGRYQGSLLSAQERSPPIFNYARFLSWVQAVEDVRAVFYQASKKAAAHVAVQPDLDWVGGGSARIDPANRTGSMEQIEEYCRVPGYVRRSRWGPDVGSRIFVASLAGLALQWLTAGAAIVVVWFSPTRGNRPHFLLLRSTQTLRHACRTGLPFCVSHRLCKRFHDCMGYASRFKHPRALWDNGDTSPAAPAVCESCQVVFNSPSARGQRHGRLQYVLDHRVVTASVQWCLQQLLLWQ